MLLLLLPSSPLPLEEDAHFLPFQEQHEREAGSWLQADRRAGEQAGRRAGSKAGGTNLQK
jgi:hypothetical protein